MFVVDTNLLVYAAHPDSELHERARTLLEEWRQRHSPWYLTWGICYEFLRVTTHSRVFRRPWTAREAVEFLQGLFAARSLGLLVPTGRHMETLAGITARLGDLRGNIMHDTATVVLMNEHGIRTIYSRDTDFHRFPSIEVVDPLRLE